MRRAIALMLMLSFTLFSLGAVPASADDISSSKGFRKAVTLGGVREHQFALQQIADQHGGSRAAGTAGHEASADYVAQKAQAAGLVVTSQAFDFERNADETPPAFEQLSPFATTYVAGQDFFSLAYSSDGNATAPLVVPGGDPEGCGAGDFAGFPAGSVALVRRGGCTLRQQALNAVSAGASAVIIYNAGGPGATGAFEGTLDGPGVNAPVISTSAGVGSQLASAPGAVVRVEVDRIDETRSTRNVVAETAGGDPERVVIVGAHLDSDASSPGINDNGSGAAVLLEIAETYSAQGREPRNKLRLVWFGASGGTAGSAHYVSSLSPVERQRVLCMLNFDALGSPNFVRFVHDGDDSGGANTVAAPPGSAFVEQVFLDYFASQGLAAEAAPLDDGSDHAPFATAAGIPVGGLTAGSTGVKTPAQAAVYGGASGVPYDPCAGAACDTFANNSDAALDQMSDAAAHAVLFFSKTKEDIRAQ